MQFKKKNNTAEDETKIDDYGDDDNEIEEIDFYDDGY